MSVNDVMGPLSNFSPIGAMALFGGAYFAKSKAFAFPLLALWLGDILLNRFVYFGEWVIFYEGFYWIYGAFALMVLVGTWLLKQVTIPNFLLSTLVITLIHWIVTDLGVWLGGTMYPMTWAGWWACLVAAIPFEINFFLGTLIYGTVMFGLFEWFEFKFPILKTQEPTI